MSKLNCYGTEEDIASCSFPGWGKGGCQSSTYISIGCGKQIQKNEYKCYISKELSLTTCRVPGGNFDDESYSLIS